MAHDTFQVSAAAAAAVVFLVVQRDDAVTVFPDALGEGVHAVADAGAKRPDAHHVIELAGAGCEARGHGVGIIDQSHGRG